MRIGKLLRALVVAGPIAVIASASHAVPITYNFTSGNVTGPSLGYSVGGVALTVTGFTYTAPQTVNSQVLVDQSNNGLGVCGTQPVGVPGGCGANPLLDGGSAAGNDNELLRFTFSSAVTLQSVSFVNNDTNDVFDFFLGDPLALQFSFLTPIQGQRDYFFDQPYPFGSIFGFGVTGNSDQVRIAGLTVLSDVAVVPLPAGLVLLLSAFAALGVLRRKRGPRHPVAF